MPLHVYDHAKVLEYMRPNDGFALRTPNDDVASDRLPAEIKQAEPVGELLHAAVGHFERDRAGRLDT